MSGVSVKSEINPEGWCRQYICGPADRIVFSMGKKDGQHLRALMENAENREIKVVLNARSHVSKGGVSAQYLGRYTGKDR